MRLPAFLTAISPVGETLTAAERGQALLEQETAARNGRLLADTDEEGLKLWEADYSLAGGAGMRAEERCARIRAALSGGQTLTRERLKALCVSIGGADDAEVEEFFADRRVTVTALYENNAPADLAVLEKTVRQMKPAHLQLEVSALGLLRADDGRHLALTGDVFFVLHSRDGE